MQYQFVLPLEAREGLVKILNRISNKGLGSFLAVLRYSGNRKASFHFPGKGFTLALDFPVKAGLLEFLDELDQIVLEYGGRLYMSKDARMKPDVLRRGYPDLKKFKDIVRKYNARRKDPFDPVRQVIINNQLIFMATVLILGATSDIGVAIARKFAFHQFDVLLAGRKPEQLKPLESDIRIRYGVSCNSVAFDALQYSTHAGFFNSLQPKPDISVCVFGILDDEELAFDDWQITERMINTNYTGAVLHFKRHSKKLYRTKKRNHYWYQFCSRRQGQGK